jgi:DNA-binding XRE family transcriptional regulator
VTTRVQPKVNTRVPTGVPTGSPRQAPGFSSKRLLRLLREHGLSKQQLHGEVLRRGVNTHVRRLFEGGQPSLKLAWAIADALGVQIEDLLEEST